MNSDIFNSYLEALKVKMAEQCRKVLMLVDNTPPHLVLETTPQDPCQEAATTYDSLQPQDA
ncbi:hypothetical protein H310_06309 [Aphanomyces invadans]|uniref:DDE-1 domain-containing protein n=1 Tax=Aphanomyces invadans TaxID=157072 RepID=A0A024U7W0_9STRA|nr:hypothetical protein H310_06309 [Aphanomyces invadans]ETW01693.1 hypothetical protein H310_06309 [Aphanomyces invadans]|eukprot:XP_008869541.1 hypothetical protein H310_06309 [Aphanomyces invadans]